MTQIHKCSACENEFGSDDEYGTHVCDRTGASPVDPEHQDILTGGAFSRQAEKAQERGENRQDE